MNNRHQLVSGQRFTRKRRAKIRQTARRQKTQARWRNRNPDYAIGWRIDRRLAQAQQPPELLRLPAPLNQLPWDVAKDQFGAKGADFIGFMGSLILRVAKDQF